MAINTSSGFSAEVDTQALDRLLSINTADGKRDKEIKALISKALANARKQVSEQTRVLMTNDKRQSWRAVKYSIYKQILGGNVSIFSRKRAGARASLPTSTRGRSADTERYESYLGADRSFILRIMNAGTDQRISQRMNNHPIMRNSSKERKGNRSYVSKVIGYRGVWKGKEGFFANNAAQAMGNAAIELSQAICNALVQEINNYKG